MCSFLLDPSFILRAFFYFKYIYVMTCSGVCVYSNLRVDSLAQILNEANVRAHNKLIVMESCLGLVLGAVMERMAGWYLNSGTISLLSKCKGIEILYLTHLLLLHAVMPVPIAFRKQFRYKNLYLLSSCRTGTLAHGS